MSPGGVGWTVAGHGLHTVRLACLCVCGRNPCIIFYHLDPPTVAETPMPPKNPRIIYWGGERTSEDAEQERLALNARMLAISEARSAAARASAAGRRGPSRPPGARAGGSRRRLAPLTQLALPDVFGDGEAADGTLQDQASRVKGLRADFDGQRARSCSALQRSAGLALAPLRPHCQNAAAVTRRYTILGTGSAVPRVPGLLHAQCPYSNLLLQD
jgi:hypothetical protein